MEEYDHASALLTPKSFHIMHHRARVLRITLAEMAKPVEPTRMSLYRIVLFLVYTN